MRTPSVKTLSAVFPDPKAAKRVLQMTRAELIATPQGAALWRACYHPPTTDAVRMEILNELAGTHGVEGFQLRDDSWVEYLNAGDIYATTLLLVRGKYRVGCWGDIAKRN